MNTKIASGIVGLAAVLAGCASLPPTSAPPSGGLPAPPPVTTDSRSGTSATPASSPSSSPTSDSTATTADERRDELDRRFDESLDEFDKTLTADQRRTAEEREARTANAGSSGGGTDGGEVATAGRPGDLRSERGAREGASSAAAAGGGADRSADRGVVGAGSGAPDRSIPSGDDDDIIARRLRRAAEQETDPELKEKLWNEYIEYKRNAQGKG